MTPGFRLTMGGRDLTRRFNPRLSSLTLTEKRGEEADQLEIVLTDTDGQLDFPAPQATLSIALGFGDDLTPKGSFKVDEFEWGGPPDILTIRARSADFTQDLAARRSRSWTDVKLGDVVGQIAAAANLQPRVDPDLEGLTLPLVTQSRESDLALLRRLGREHDAVATIKDGRLLFARIGRGLTTSGLAIPDVILTPASGDRYAWRAAERDSGGSGSSSARNDNPAGVRARWRDTAAGVTKSVLVGRSAGARTLPRIYPTEAAAERAARAAHDRRARKKATFTLTLAVGRPDLYPERPVTLQGFKPRIDDGRWLISQVSHAYTDQGGLTTDLTLEAAA